MTSVTAELSLMRPDGTNFTEVEMTVAEPGQFSGFLGMDGRVTLVHGEERFDIGDTLLYAVTELCGKIAPPLKSDGQAVYSAIAHEEQLTFNRSGDTIEITSAYRKGITLPADDTLAALINAGRRLCALLPRLWSTATPEEIEAVTGTLENAVEELGLG